MFKKIIGGLLALMGIEAVLTKSAGASIPSTFPELNFDPITELDDIYIPATPYGEDAPRGIRNNNPGNIERGENWQGMSNVQNDTRFITFISPEYGLRALGKLLQNYQTLYGLDTIRGIVSRYAPSSENNTQAYVDFVSRETGFGPDQPLNLQNRETLVKLMQAIVIQENGVGPQRYWYNANLYSQGFERIYA